MNGKACRLDANRFDGMTRSLTKGWSRRMVMAGPGAALGLVFAGSLLTPGSAKKLRRNQFGCVNVGGKCRGKDKHCCSGICQGKKPKKGDNDKSRCVAHDEQECQAGQIEGICGGTDVPCTTITGDSGFCDTTTGNAGYCAGASACIVCKKDADCIADFGPRAACVVCEGCEGDVRCAGPG